LTFDTTATHFTFARARTTANAHTFLGGTWVVTQFVQFHIASPLPELTPEA
jgi:hypothetical protein